MSNQRRGPHSDPKEHQHGPGCAHDHDETTSEHHAHDEGKDHPGHHHHHGFGHHHHHHHGSGAGGDHQRVIKGLRLTFFLNFGFAIFELIGGYLTNSVAVMSDALHDMGDALALGLAWWFEKKSVQKASPEYSYGYRRFSLLSSVFTGAILLIGGVFVVREAVTRLFEPEPVVVWGMFVMAFFGIAINGWGLLQFSSQGGASERMVRLHLIEDVAGWIVLLVTAVIMQFVHLPWLDAVVAIGISAWIMMNVVRQLVSVASVFLQAIPVGLSVEKIEKMIRDIRGVTDCHHTHVWSLDGEKHILTTHIRLPSNTDIASIQKIKSEVKTQLRKKFRIFEATIEIEFDGEPCETPEH